MWIRRSTFERLIEQSATREAAANYATSKALIEQSRALGEVQRLQIENERLRADMDWFKHRLNQVEKERAQLILAATGTKIAYPEFTPAYNPEDALNQLPDLSTVGGDARDEFDSAPQEMSGVDYSLLPGYKK